MDEIDRHIKGRYGALLYRNEYPHLRAAPRSWTVNIYDLDRPRMPEASDPHLHYMMVRVLGPYPTLAEAECMAAQAIT